MGSAEMTEGIWGKISQLNAGDAIAKAFLVLRGSWGPTTSLQMISDCQS